MKLIKKIIFIVGVFLLSSALYAEEEKYTPNFYLNFNSDADFALGFGDAYSGIGHALDANLTVGANFAKNVSTELYLTLTTGNGNDLPAGGPVDSSGRFNPALAFDGAALIWSDIGGIATLTFLDGLVDYGKTVYYLYKNRSFISPEIFPRGLGVSLALSDTSTLDFGWGINSAGFSDAYATYLHYNYNLEDNIGFDFYFTWNLGENETEEGERIGNNDEIRYDSDIYLGAEFKIGDAFKFLASIPLTTRNGYTTGFIGGIDGSIDPDGSFYFLYTLLGQTGNLEVTEDGEEINTSTSSLLGSTGDGFSDNVFIYLEPGWSFANDYLAFSPIVEYHRTGSIDIGNSRDQIWFVPTLYIYPADNVEIWLWAQGIWDVGGGSGEESTSANFGDYFAGMELIFRY